MVQGIVLYVFPDIHLFFRNSSLYFLLRTDCWLS